MSYSSKGKQWLPARFTTGGGGGLEDASPFVVIISNQPLENRSLLLELCRKGERLGITSWRTMED